MKYGRPMCVFDASEFSYFSSDPTCALVLCENSGRWNLLAVVEIQDTQVSREAFSRVSEHFAEVDWGDGSNAEGCVLGLVELFQEDVDFCCCVYSREYRRLVVVGKGGACFLLGNGQGSSPRPKLDTYSTFGGVEFCDTYAPPLVNISCQVFSCGEAVSRGRYIRAVDITPFCVLIVCSSRAKHHMTRFPFEVFVRVGDVMRDIMTRSSRWFRATMGYRAVRKTPFCVVGVDMGSPRDDHAVQSHSVSFHSHITHKT